MYTGIHISAAARPYGTAGASPRFPTCHLRNCVSRAEAIPLWMQRKCPGNKLSGSEAKVLAYFSAF